jgi:hypothetical protein
MKLTADGDVVKNELTGGITVSRDKVYKGLFTSQREAMKCYELTHKDSDDPKRGDCSDEVFVVIAPNEGDYVDYKKLGWSDTTIVANGKGFFKRRTPAPSAVPPKNITRDGKTTFNGEYYSVWSKDGKIELIRTKDANASAAVYESHYGSAVTQEERDELLTSAPAVIMNSGLPDYKHYKLHGWTDADLVLYGHGKWRNQPSAPSAPAHDAELLDETHKLYSSLKAVLDGAYNQAAFGKGANRHAQGKPFTEQPIQLISELIGTHDGLIYQLIKKAQESQRMEPDAAIRELYGVIVYTAGAIIYLQKKHGVKLP